MSSPVPSHGPNRLRSWLSAAAALTMVAGVTSVVLTSSPAAAANDPITVEVTASQNPVASGAELTYSIDVVNTGGAQVDDVVMTNQFNGLTGLILTSDVGACQQDANLVTCDAGSLEGFQSWRVTIRGDVTAADGTTLHNTATVTGTKSATTFTVAHTTSVLVSNLETDPLPDLSLSIQGPNHIGESDAVTYDLTVNNTGSDNTTEVTVVNTLPNGFTFTQVTGTSLFECTNAPAGSLTVVCTGGAINAGANATITIDAVSGADPGPFENTAKVDPYDEIGELNELNNTASHVAQKDPPPPQEGLTITKTDLVDPIRPGQMETYQIRVENIADRRADRITITDGTQGLEAASIEATTTKGECTVAASEVTCTQRGPWLRLDPGESLDITIKGIVVHTAGSLITNTATVSGNIKNTGVTNTATTTTTVRPGVDLTVVQHAVNPHTHPAGSELFRAWDHFDYEITIGNSGLDDAEDVVVREPLPEGMDLKSYSAPAGVTCNETNNVVRCTGLTVDGVLSSGQPGGTIEKITLTVVAPPTPRTIEATVTVDPGNAIFESDETNNTTTTTTVIDTGIDLTVTKTGEEVVAPSGTLIYTITVPNIGTQDAEDVVVRDFLPAGTRFREVVGDHDFTCSHDGAGAGGQIECVGGRIRGTHDHNLAPDAAEITITLFAPAAPGLIKNQVRVDPDNAIPEILEDNNINTRMTDIQIGGCCEYHEFSIDKSQVTPDGAVAPAGILEYDIVVTNHGSDVAFDVVVRDFLPEGAVFRSAVDTLPGTGAFSCSEADGVVDCVGGTLDGSTGQTAQAGDTTRTIHLSVFAPDQPGDYENQAVIDPDEEIPEGDETNNSDVVTTTVALGGGGSYIDLLVDSRQSSPVDGGGNPVAVVPSGVLQYELKPRNAGTAVAFDVTVRDVLPAGVEFRSARDLNPGDGAFECAENGGVVTCTGGTLDGTNDDTPAAGDNVRTIVIDVFAPAHPGSYVNQAYIDPDEKIAENDETNNSDQTTTEVSLSGQGKYRDLTVSGTETTTVADSPPGQAADQPLAEPQPGQAYQQAVTVENTGTDVVFNATTRHQLAPGVELLSATAENGFGCSASGNVSNGLVVTCTGGTLDGSNDQAPNHDSDAIIKLRLRAPQQHNLSYDLRSTIDPGNAVAESDETNNTDVETLTVKSKINLTVDVGTGSATKGNEGDWTFTLDNTEGNETAYGVEVVFNLTVGGIVLDVEAPSTEWSCQVYENPVNQVVCNGDLTQADQGQAFTVRYYQTGDEVHSSAVVDPNDTIVETNENDNTDQQ